MPLTAKSLDAKTEKREVEESVQVVSIGSITLESGAILPEVDVVVETVGTLSTRTNNAVLVCHALTGDARAVGDMGNQGWWRGLIHSGGYVNTEEWFVITMNVLGGCSGTTGPTSINPETGEAYRSSFPYVSVRDMVHVQKRCLEILGIDSLHGIIGGSMGGMLVLEWGLLYPECVGRIIPIATASSLTPTAIAYNDIGRQAIVSDPAFKEGEYDANCPPVKGLAIARMMGMVTYRTNSLFEKRFSRALQEGIEENPSDSVFQIESYLRYQGKKLAERFDANSYLTLLKAMDTHDIGRGRGGVKAALAQLRCPILVIGIQEDILFPIHQQREIYKLVQHRDENQLLEVSSEYGHDAFLLEFDEIGPAIQKFLS
ncbi:homoserine O-acetyltransferase [Marininema mesophilum]|uniref:Homoserine O-acetyltransferase n=1 Tax=Marininema mesophilum TaxID=1048340 RepID=A0A1H2RTQ9_9BACL|nr:homoserine O-acetyltransferase [Marininema mesophilum]SDW22811.1 homoserine O-acetyltransferase [Marininema mesophilum]